MKKNVFEFNLFTGSISAVIILVLSIGFYLVRANIMDKAKNSAENFLVSALDAWESGKTNRLSRIIPDDFDGSPADWRELDLTDYFIEKVTVKSKYVSRKRHGIWYYVYKLSLSNFYVYAKVELNLEDADGNAYTYNITYRLEPLGGDKWLVTKSAAGILPLF